MSSKIKGRLGDLILKKNLLSKYNNLLFFDVSITSFSHFDILSSMFISIKSYLKSLYLYINFIENFKCNILFKIIKII
ncbi:hypothetical protein TZ01_08880 [Acidiplasma sp. MBA-1]|nr:hypothetical protein TZ01_08880 [Acidiplasma sp. MBA-1]